MLKDKPHVLLQYFLCFVLRQQQHVEAGMGSWQVQSVRVPLDQKFKRFYSINGDPVGASDESEEIFLLFVAETVQEVPELPEWIQIYLMTGVSGVYPPS